LELALSSVRVEQEESRLFSLLFALSKRTPGNGEAQVPFNTFFSRRTTSWPNLGLSTCLRTGIWKVELDPSGNFLCKITRRTISAQLTIRHPTMPYMRVKIGRFSGSPRSKVGVVRGHSRESFNFLPLLSRLCLEDANDERIGGGGAIVNPTRPKQTAMTVRSKPNECVLSCTAQMSGLLIHRNHILKSLGKRVTKRGIVQVRLHQRWQLDIWFLRWDVG
jgi:hypothetical protein